ncbi:carbon-nitrogen hydrolase [Dichotomocladium elegans]|nr:carbon-nitrogen hydrolase [Dichotomocladium elegans]
MKWNNLLRDHWLVIPLLLISPFVTGIHGVPIVTLLYPAFVIYYARKQWMNVGISYGIIAFGTAISILSIFDVEPELPPFQNTLKIFGLSLLGNIVTLLSLAGDRWAQSQRCAWHRVLAFPCLWTGFWFAFTRFSGFGDVVSYSASVMGWSDFVQAAATLGGRPMIDFFLVFSCTILLELKDNSALTPIFFQGDEEEQHQDNTVHHRVSRPVVVFGVVMGLMLAFGGVQTSIYPGSFFQVGYVDYVTKTVPAGCVVGPGGIHPELQADHNRWFNKTLNLAKAGAKIIIWSEETAQVQDPDAEQQLIERAKGIAAEENVYIGLTYELSGPVMANKFALVTPGGDVPINYIKSHPVPYVELFPAGPSVLQVADTPEFGRIGVAICFDFNFPWFIRQASQKNVDLMLQPSWTWGSMGTYHSQGNSLRAVENGFTLLRCGSQGLSGVFDPVMNGLFSQHMPTVTDAEYIFNLPLRKRRWTLYGSTGDVFGYMCIAAGLLGAGYHLYHAFKARRAPIQL